MTPPLIKAITLPFLAAIMIFISVEECSARKRGYRLKTPPKASAARTVITEDADTVPEMVSGSFMVASQCSSCNNGYRLEQVVFTGFDKNRSSSKESFFIINNTDRTLTAVNLYIEYLTPDGRQLHKRFLKLSCSIPPGETRKADIPSWDTQRSFHYYKSTGKNKGGNLFMVNFDPVAFWLSFD